MLKSKIKRKNALVVAAISVGLVAGISVAPSTAAPKNLARAVVQTDWLEKNLDNPDVKIIEVSTEAGLYERGHIKNAVKFNWYTDLVEVVNRDSGYIKLRGILQMHLQFQSLKSWISPIEQLKFWFLRELRSLFGDVSHLELRT